MSDLTNPSNPRIVTACVVLIGDEVLSGRTRDANLGYIAKHLNQIGVQVREARVIPDNDGWRVH